MQLLTEATPLNLQVIPAKVLKFPLGVAFECFDGSTCVLLEVLLWLG